MERRLGYIFKYSYLIVFSHGLFLLRRMSGQAAESYPEFIKEGFMLTMCPNGYWSLKDYHKKFDFYVRFMLAPPKFDFSPPFILTLDQDLCLDEETAGGKASVLALLKQALGLPVPQGFVITTRAFHLFMEAGDLYPFVRQQLAALDIDDPASLAATARTLEKAVLAAPLPEEGTSAGHPGGI